MKIAAVEKSLPIKSTSSSAFFRALYAFIEKQESPHTKTAYFRDLREFFAEFKALDPLAITQEHVILYKNILKERYALATVARRLSTVRSFYAWLESERIVSRSPARAVQPPKLATHGKTPEVSDADVNRIFNAVSINSLHGRRDLLILQFLFYLGLRASELAGIRLEHFDQESGYEVLTITGKGQKSRRIPIRPHLMNSVRELLAHEGRVGMKNGFLFRPYSNNRGKTTDKGLSTVYLRNLVIRYARKSGYRGKITTHSARVTACSNAAEHSASTSELQDAFGWSSPTTVERYRRRRGQIKNSALHRVNY